MLRGDAMPKQDQAFVIQPDKRDVLNWEDKRRFQRKFNVQAVRSYLFLSLGMGVIAFLLPILLVIAGEYGEHFSISHFYHASGETSRNILVGSLCATGAFLFLFHGLSRTENWILNLAGIAAISVAMNPTSVEQCTGGARFPSIHVLSAILFFICLALVAVVFAKGRLDYIIYPPKRRRFKMAYNVAGFAMIAMPAAVAAIHFFPWREKGVSECSHWIFWIECFGIWAFSFFWFVKTLEYRLLLRIR
jgi:hypothetical protein